MKKLLTLLTLLASLVLSGSAWAEWVKIDSSNVSDFYIDPETIRKDGSLRRIWLIQNLKQRNKDGELSEQTRVEYDCKQERFRLLSLSTHSGPMASGTNLFRTGEEATWTDIPPNTVVEVVLKIVCAK